MTADIRHGDCLEVLAAMPDNSVDAVVCDPPYGLEFMGKEWDAPWKDERTDTRGVIDPKTWGGNQDSAGGGNPYSRARIRTAASHYGGNPAAVGRQFQQWCELWTAECLRVLKPGGHLLAFGGTRTWHRLACAVEDAGFEMRDSIAWLYGSGFPKSLDVSKAIDKAAGAEREVVGQRDRLDQSSKPGHSFTYSGPMRAQEDALDITAPATEAARQWQGWGTALKPAFEPVVVARKPLVGNVAQNVLAYGTGAINVDACRIGTEQRTNGGMSSLGVMHDDEWKPRPVETTVSGRWPANVVLDEDQAAALDQQSGTLTSGKMRPTHTTAGTSGRPSAYGADAAGGFTTMETYGDSGGASRFFYVAKAPKSERPVVDGIAHPTVKPLALMRWLVRLVTPPGGTVLDPFAGSGTTIEAAILEGFNVVGIEREADYLPLIQARIERASGPRPVRVVEPTDDAEEVVKVVSEVWDLFS